MELNKSRLELDIDLLPIDANHRERKLHDMQMRLDGLYYIIVEIEDHLADAKLRKKSVETEAITLENIYKILQHLGDLYDIISDEERKERISYLIKEIQEYPESESDCPLQSIKFNFPVFQNGLNVRELFLKQQTNVETLFCLERKLLN